MNIAQDIKSPISQALRDEVSSEPASPNESWNDLVFQKRNKEYGAYVLRRGYASNVYVGVLFAIAAFLLVIFLPAIVRFFSSSETELTTAPKKLVYTELSAPPPIDKPKPPPPQVQLPKLQKVIKFVPPKVVKEEVVEEVPTIQEIKENVTAATEVEGTEDVIFEEPVEQVVAEDPNELFTVVEQMPEFEGGYDMMMEFIKSNMRYPNSARRMGIEGIVYVNFIVGKDGTISEAKVLRGISADCDTEALRVVNMMPKWRAGRQNGRPVNVRFTLPLKFRLR